LNTVLITGANGGIGMAMVELFLENNYKVFAHYNIKKDNLEKIQSENLLIFQANLIDVKETEGLFEKVLQVTETIDVLINNAGVYNPVGTFNNLNTELLDEALNINLKAPFILSKKFILLMKKFNNGRIINISSIGVKYGGSPLSMPYTISKAALETMTISIAKEAAKYNILVNSLRVGVVDTNIHKNSVNKSMNNRINMIPLKRMAKPMEIAEYVLFLSSDKSSFTTGSIISIAGGE